MMERAELPVQRKRTLNGVIILLASSGWPPRMIPQQRPQRQVTFLFHAAAASYQPRERFTMCTTESITGTSTSTPTTVASAAPELRPKSVIAAATASSKKLLAPMSAEGPATLWATRKRRL